jgi:prepilin-type N-terminal cleavage/methylation domain-containing protein
MTHRVTQFRNAQAGFSIVELVVAIFVFSLLSLGLMSLVSNIFIEQNKQGMLVADAESARKYAFDFTHALRNAQYGVNGAYPLAIALPQEMVLYADIDNDSVTERVHYYISGGKLYYGRLEPSGNPATYTVAQESVSKLSSNVANGAAPLFMYYGDSYTGSPTSTPLSQPVPVTQVRYIQMQWVLANKAARSASSTYTVIAGGALRNLKTNLGN